MSNYIYFDNPHKILKKHPSYLWQNKPIPDAEKGLEVTGPLGKKYRYISLYEREISSVCIRILKCVLGALLALALALVPLCFSAYRQFFFANVEVHKCALLTPGEAILASTPFDYEDFISKYSAEDFKECTPKQKRIAVEGFLSYLKQQNLCLKNLQDYKTEITHLNISEEALANVILPQEIDINKVYIYFRENNGLDSIKLCATSKDPGLIKLLPLLKEKFWESVIFTPDLIKSEEYVLDREYLSVTEQDITTFLENKLKKISLLEFKKTYGMEAVQRLPVQLKQSKIAELIDKIENKSMDQVLSDFEDYRDILPENYKNAIASFHQEREEQKRLLDQKMKALDLTRNDKLQKAHDEYRNALLPHRLEKIEALQKEIRQKTITINKLNSQSTNLAEEREEKEFLAQISKNKHLPEHIDHLYDTELESRLEASQLRKQVTKLDNELKPLLDAIQVFKVEANNKLKEVSEKVHKEFTEAVKKVQEEDALLLQDLETRYKATLTQLKDAQV